jgi:hypothetical protein
MLKRLAVLGVALLVAAAPLAAQGKEPKGDKEPKGYKEPKGDMGPKGYKVTKDRALVVTREVLAKQGYEVVAVENRGPDIIVWYRRYEVKKGKAKAKGPKVRMVIHREMDRVVFLEAPNPILVDIDLRLKF